ncbi:MAG TPA: DUF5069 domain-containing protein [Limnochordia bacterium]|nr:DUF5069 domain-containing protein [Limnochordia bacterium]
MAQPWRPRHWATELCGVIWLARLLDKARRAVAGERQGRNLMNGYLYGESDYMDAQLLQFLKTGDRYVKALVAENTDDDQVAERLIRESGRSPDELAEWCREFRRRNARFLEMFDADEGRMGLSPRALWLKYVYNKKIMPGAYARFEAAERRRGAPSSDEPPRAASDRTTCSGNASGLTSGD